MDPRTLIASRIDMQLRRHLGQGVDACRAVNDRRYALDMLLVCDAMADTDLPQLARQFRAAGEQVEAGRRGGAISDRYGGFSRNSSAPSATWSPTP